MSDGGLTEAGDTTWMNDLHKDGAVFPHVVSWVVLSSGLPVDVKKGEFFTDPFGKRRRAYNDLPKGHIPWLDPNDIGAFLKSPFESITLNTSGITPTENKVLILPKEVEEAASEVTLADGSKIKIYKPVESAEKEKWATMEGTLIARSPLAFSYASAEEWKAANAEPPKPGLRVLFAKYSGVRHKGRDGVEYVIANDKDVLAVLDD